MARPRTVARALRDMLEEIVEFIEEPGHEEGSDVCFTLGRLLGAICGRVYVRVPGDARCYEKMHRRYRESGCVRSLRHREFGHCATEGN